MIRVRATAKDVRSQQSPTPRRSSFIVHRPRYTCMSARALSQITFNGRTAEFEGYRARVSAENQIPPTTHFSTMRHT
jgi:hypothetical protein